MQRAKFYYQRKGRRKGLDHEQEKDVKGLPMAGMLASWELIVEGKNVSERSNGRGMKNAKTGQDGTREL